MSSEFDVTIQWTNGKFEDFRTNANELKNYLITPKINDIESYRIYDRIRANVSTVFIASKQANDRWTVSWGLTQNPQERESVDSIGPEEVYHYFRRAFPGAIGGKRSTRRNRSKRRSTRRRR